MSPNQKQRELVGQELIVGEARARRRATHERGLGVRCVRGVERVPPWRPAALGDPGRVLPFGQVGRAADGLADCPHQRLGRQPGGHRIDRLDRLQPRDLVGRSDMIGMGHLGHAVVVLDLA